MHPEASLPAPVLFALAALLGACIVAEHRWAKRRGRKIGDPTETLANLGIFVGMRVAKLLTVGYAAVLFELATDLSRSLGLSTLDATPVVVVVTFFATDFVYYLYHRAMHEIRALWCLHQVHHSSPWMNLTTAGRLNWLSPLLSPLVYAPLVVLGLPGTVIAAAMGLNLLFQFFLHTEAIGELPVVEGWINTPSAHRVHHASDAPYLDKNFGGVLMVWDRLFGTYAREHGPLTYGITTGFQGHNPFWLVFGGFVDYARGRAGSKG